MSNGRKVSRLLAASARWGLAGLAAGVLFAVLSGLEHLSGEGSSAAVPDFELSTHQGQSFTAAHLTGQHVLLYFGYTHCPDVCPVGLFAMRTILNGLGTAGDSVLPLFVTLDPARDDAAVLAGYVTAFHERIVGLTGAEEQIRGFAEFFSVQYSTRGEGENYLVDHSTYLYLLSPTGDVLRTFPHGVEPEFAAGVIRGEMRAEGATSRGVTERSKYGRTPG